MMSKSCNQNMDSWKSGNRYNALQNMGEQENMIQSTDKKSVVKLVLPIKTYKDEQKERCQNDHRHSQRAEAYNTLSNKTELGNNLAKTRMCDSVKEKKNCRHGKACRFAHSLEELVTRDCFFKNECRFVRFERDKLVNNGRDICRNKHPHETENEFIERVGLSHYKTTHVPTHVPTHVTTPKVTLEKSTTSWATTLKASLKTTPLLEEKHQHETKNEFIERVGLAHYKTTHVPPPKVVTLEKSTTSWATTLKASLKNTPPQEEKQVLLSSLPPQEEVVLRVPRELVMQALELAIKSGNTSIRVKVVE